MPELLNAVTSTESFTTYDRSYAGQFENPYVGVPGMTFHMHRVTIRDRDDALVASESLPNVVEPFNPGKVYELFNPSTGEKIPDQTFMAEQAYAIIYSMMIRAISDREAALAAAAAALAARLAEEAALAAAAAAEEAAAAAAAGQ